MKHNPGIGATNELSLRVSVATLVKVIFKHPSDGEWTLALERKATLYEDKVEIKSQPFGGAIRMLELDTIHDLIGDFHFDSERSRAEQDFRLFIRPSSWSALREFCIQHLSLDSDTILETNPTREMNEEFEEILKITLTPDQYKFKSTGLVLEDEPAPTENFYSRAFPTVRLYRIFEAAITDPLLITAVLKNSEGLSNEKLKDFALADKAGGGNGWANAALVLSLNDLTAHYLSLSLPELSRPVFYESNRLDETVSAILEDITIKKYRRL